MIDKKSVVKLVNMFHEYETGLDRYWLEGVVGEVVRMEYVRPNYGFAIVKTLTPVYDVNKKPIEWLGGIHVSNLQEIIRQPFKREPITQQGG